MSNAEITGIDTRSNVCNLNDPCNCPGGFFVIIENVSSPTGATFRAKNLPDYFVLGDKPAFPVSIKINWQHDIQCNSDIVITKILRR